jgi:peroxiredoxin
LEKAIQELEGHQAVAKEEFAKALELWKKSGGIGEGLKAQIQFRAGEKEPAEKALRKYAADHAKEVLPRIELILLLWQAEKKEDAKKEFEELRRLAGHADLSAPAIARVANIAQELGYPTDWRLPEPPASDVGIRPSLDSLGPFRWQPATAPSWTLPDAEGKEHASTEHRGRPLILIFFLGNRCLHCAEQLHAFAKRKAEFDAAGLPLLAISSDDREGLKTSIENYTGGALPIPLLSDPNHTAFQAYRAFDDFENQCLHGTFVIDPNGTIRWQDIGYEPFMDVSFVLKEAQRLLDAKK